MTKGRRLTFAVLTAAEVAGGVVTLSHSLPAAVLLGFAVATAILALAPWE